MTRYVKNHKNAQPPPQAEYLNVLKLEI